jgi:hypothetical protein
MTIENPNVKGIWTTIEVDEEGTETVLIVETDLELNAALPAFDAAKVDALIEAATKSFAASGGTFDRIHLVPIMKPAVKKVRKGRKESRHEGGADEEGRQEGQVVGEEIRQEGCEEAR